MWLKSGSDIIAAKMEHRLNWEQAENTLYPTLIGSRVSVGSNSEKHVWYI